jgi:hypothetical protein
MSLITIKNTPYIAFILCDNEISGEPFYTNYNKKTQTYHFQMLRDISFNGYCNIGDRLKFKIILLESNGKNIRLQMHEFLDEKLDKKTTNEITVCNIDYEISLTDTEQKIYDNNDDTIGVINMMIAKYDNNNTQYMYMLPEASVKLNL